MAFFTRENKSIGWWYRIADSFQPAYDKFKAITPDPKVVEIADKIMAILPTKVGKALMKAIEKAYKKYGTEYATQLVRDILRNISVYIKEFSE